MRYTTIIDITELPQVYRNVNARLLYLHLVLRSGYHNEDRDLARISLRVLASSVGLTLSATRHALHILGDAGLVVKEGDAWRVRKWFVADPPTPRTQRNTAKASVVGIQDGRPQEVIDAERAAARQAYQARLLKAVRECSPDELRTWLSEIQDGRQKEHHGAYLSPSKANIEWLGQIIQRL